MFDEEPEGDPHGECAEEIKKLRAEVERLKGDTSWKEALGKALREVESLKLQVDEARIAFTAIVMATGDSTNPILMNIRSVARRGLKHTTNDSTPLPSSPGSIEILKKIEWVSVGDGSIKLCPNCGQDRGYGHNNNCALAKAVGSKCFHHPNGVCPECGKGGPSPVLDIVCPRCHGTNDSRKDCPKSECIRDNGHEGGHLFDERRSL